MNKQRSWIIICLLATIMCIGALEIFWHTRLPLLEKAQFRDTAYQLNYTVYHDNEDGKYYLFLPSYISLDSLEADFPNNVNVSYICNGNNYNFNNLPLGEDIEVTLKTALLTEKYTLQILQCANLPTIYIETESGNLDDVNSSKDNDENALTVLVNTDGSIEYSGVGNISGRGNSTFGQPKNAYNLNFPQDISAWEFNEVDKLCLLANYYDESSLRNLIGFNTAKEKGIDYTSSYQMVNLYANGEYLGLYGVATKQEYKKHIEEDGIVAAFEFTYDDLEKDSFCSKNGIYIKVFYGDADYVQTVVETFEDALLTRDYGKAYNYINIDSFAKKNALEDFLVNFDIAGYSQYFYIDRQGKINYMCAWDYDNILGSMNMDDYDNLAQIGLQLYRSKSSWWRYLLEDEYFRNQAIHILETEYDDVFYQGLFEKIYDWVDNIDASWKCDRIRWDNELEYEGFGYENLAEYTSMYDNVICDRSSFLISYLTAPDKYRIVEFISMRGGNMLYYSNICVPYRSLFVNYTEDYSVTAYEGWYTADGLLISDVNAVVNDITFYRDVDTLTEDPSSFTFHRLVIYGAFGAFGLISLLLACVWVKRQLRRSEVRK